MSVSCVIIQVCAVRAVNYIGYGRKGGVGVVGQGVSGRSEEGLGKCDGSLRRPQQRVSGPEMFWARH